MEKDHLTMLSADPPCERRLPPLLRQSWYGLNQAFRRRVAHLGITPNHYTALRWLIEAQETGLTQRELTCRMASDANTIAALVRRMEQERLIDVSIDPDDRRARRLHLTDRGSALYEQARPIALDLREEVLGVLTDRQQQTLIKLLGKVADACRQASEQNPAA